MLVMNYLHTPTFQFCFTPLLPLSKSVNFPTQHYYVHLIAPICAPPPSKKKKKNTTSHRIPGACAACTMGGDPTDWHPARMLRDRAEGEQDPTPRFALIILNQPLTDVSTLRTLWRNGKHYIVFGYEYEYGYDPSMLTLTQSIPQGCS